jgi:hypothetical protein
MTTYDQAFWQRPPRFPDSVSAVVGEALGAFYYSHSKLETLFLEHGAPSEIPEGNCAAKCTTWLRRTARDPDSDAFSVLGGVLRDFLDDDFPGNYLDADRADDSRDRVKKVLARHSISYQEGGQITAAGTGAPVKSLQEILRRRELNNVEKEFDRALTYVEKDPEAGLTAACSILEALFKTYIQDEGLDLPSDQSLMPLWKVVRTHLRLDPSAVEEKDIKKILSGLISVVDGIGEFRTHASSAHGRGRTSYKLVPRQARLAIHSAHTVCTFILETWDYRKSLTK